MAPICIFTGIIKPEKQSVVKNTYILVAYRIILRPDTTADIAGMVLITAVMSLDSVPVLPFSSGNTEGKYGSSYIKPY